MPRRNANALINGTPVPRKGNATGRVNFRTALANLAASIADTTRAGHLEIASGRASREGFVPGTQAYAERTLAIYRTLTVR